MLLLIPVVAFCLLMRAFRRRHEEWTDSMVASAVIWGVSVVAIIEGLSLFRLVSFVPIAFAWLALSVAILILDHRMRVGQIQTCLAPRQCLRSESGENVIETGFTTLVWSLTVSVSLLTALVALLSPPNTTDAMTYHLPRVVYWFTYHSVAFFPTPDVNLLVQPPFTEFTMLLTYVLAKSDRFVNLVQWLGFAGSALVVSGIAGVLGGAPASRALAAFLCIVILNGILQATGAKNDCYLSFWLMSTAYALLRYGQTASRFWYFTSAAAL